MVINHSNVLKALGVAGVVIVARPAYARDVEASTRDDAPRASAPVMSAIPEIGVPATEAIRGPRRD